MQTDLTIIIPHYNMPHSLRRLLLTIPAYDNIQVIVVDDRSDFEVNEYEKVKKDVCFNHVSFYENSVGIKSAGTCRNIGARYAAGKWILFADSDDFFTDEFYDKVAVFFTSDSDVIFFPPTSLDTDANELSYRHIAPCKILNDYTHLPSLKHELILRYFMSAPWSKMIKLNLIEGNSIRFDEIPVSNDIAFSAKVGYHMKNFFVSDDVIYCVTNSKGTLTKVLSETSYDFKLGVFIWRYNFLKEKLTKKEFALLDNLELNKGMFFLSVFKYELGVKKLISVIRTMRASGVKIISPKYLNPLFIIRIIKLLKCERREHRLNKALYTK